MRQLPVGIYSHDSNSLIMRVNITEISDVIHTLTFKKNQLKYNTQ